MRGIAFRRWRLGLARRREWRRLRWQLGFAAPNGVADPLVARAAAHPTKCSCWMCGNPRKFTGETTRQEADAESRLREARYAS